VRSSVPKMIVLTNGRAIDVESNYIAKGSPFSLSNWKIQSQVPIIPKLHVDMQSLRYFFSVSASISGSVDEQNDLAQVGCMKPDLNVSLPEIVDIISFREDLSISFKGYAGLKKVSVSLQLSDYRYKKYDGGYEVLLNEDLLRKALVTQLDRSSLSLGYICMDSVFIQTGNLDLINVLLSQNLVTVAPDPEYNGIIAVGIHIESGYKTDVDFKFALASFEQRSYLIVEACSTAVNVILRPLSFETSFDTPTCVALMKCYLEMEIGNVFSSQNTPSFVDDTEMEDAMCDEYVVPVSSKKTISFDLVMQDAYSFAFYAVCVRINSSVTAANESTTAEFVCPAQLLRGSFQQRLFVEYVPARPVDGRFADIITVSIVRRETDSIMCSQSPEESSASISVLIVSASTSPFILLSSEPDEAHRVMRCIARRDWLVACMLLN